jgi:hypothetical protein
MRGKLPRRAMRLHVPETRRDEQKLWLILFQIKAARARLNFLVWQHWLFTTLALGIGAAALVYLAAESLAPLKFLAAAGILVMFAFAAMVRTARGAWRAHANMTRAARIADQRAGLKGRLTTVLMLTDAPRPSVLWPYLVEDTYGLREEYAPSRIEPRLISRAVFALLAAILLAMGAIPFSAIARRSGAGATSAMEPPDQISADIDNLEIRPADPALQPNAQIYADPETIRRLAEKLSAANNPERNDGHGIGKALDQARDFADALQNRLIGRNNAIPPPLQLRLTAKNHDANDLLNNQSRDQQGGASGKNGGAASNAPGGAHTSPQAPGTQPNQPPMTSLPPQQADELAGNNPASPGANPAPPPPTNAPGALSGGSNDVGGGANHGLGSDPEHLFGEASNQPLGSDSFKIAIEAEPSTEASAPGSPGYLPPDVRVPLNPRQLPDEPLARAAVPVGDQLTIKRVFER